MGFAGYIRLFDLLHCVHVQFTHVVDEVKRIENASSRFSFLNLLRWTCQVTISPFSLFDTLQHGEKHGVILCACGSRFHGLLQCIQLSEINFGLRIGIHLVLKGGCLCLGKSVQQILVTFVLANFQWFYILSSGNDGCVYLRVDSGDLLLWNHHAWTLKKGGKSDDDNSDLGDDASVGNIIRATQQIRIGQINSSFGVLLADINPINEMQVTLSSETLAYAIMFCFPRVFITTTHLHDIKPQIFRQLIELYAAISFACITVFKVPEATVEGKAFIGNFATLQSGQNETCEKIDEKNKTLLMDLENNTTVNKLFITINPTLRLFQHAFTIILKKLHSFHLCSYLLNADARTDLLCPLNELNNACFPTATEPQPTELDLQKNRGDNEHKTFVIAFTLATL
ncbi:hypothetical protein EGR_10804 [Echinococcus granulosus]|uniref:Uncharacterized protein n=1 Tax=Echinococcus granulosus TaxID=6210 RepID=W6U1F2_ECHGR|nr:hypothetical protein EGR_10804 [Echinococcus granulosus]EUB54341.1 hypothetical protein EGR_10804 [Echinococcus granulosus]